MAGPYMVIPEIRFQGDQVLRGLLLVFDPSVLEILSQDHGGQIPGPAAGHDHIMVALQKIMDRYPAIRPSVFIVGADRLTLQPRLAASYHPVHIRDHPGIFHTPVHFIGTAYL